MLSVSSNAVSTVQTVHSRNVPSWVVALIALVTTVIIFTSAQVVGSLMIGIFAISQHWSSSQTVSALGDSVAVQFLYGLLANGLLVLGITLMLRWLRWSWASIGWLKPSVKHLIIGAVAIVPYFVLFLTTVAVLQKFVPTFDIQQKQEIGFNAVHGPWELVLAFISLAVLPPLAEEITMRGYLFSGLKKWLPWTVAGLIVSLLFGAAHLAEGGSSGPLWIGAIDTFWLSIVLVTLRQKTGNLWAGIVLHAIKNSVAFYALFIVGGR